MSAAAVHQFPECGPAGGGEVVARVAQVAKVNASQPGPSAWIAAASAQA